MPHHDGPCRFHPGLPLPLRTQSHLSPLTLCTEILGPAPTNHPCWASGATQLPSSPLTSSLLWKLAQNQMFEKLTPPFQRGSSVKFHCLLTRPDIFGTLGLSGTLDKTMPMQPLELGLSRSSYGEGGRSGGGVGLGAEERGEKGRDRETEGKRKRLANWAAKEAATAATRGRSEAVQLVSGAATSRTGPANRGEESHGGNSPGASDKPCLNLSCELNCPLLVSRKPRRLTSAYRRLALKVAIRKPEAIPGAPP